MHTERQRNRYKWNCIDVYDAATVAVRARRSYVSLRPNDSGARFNPFVKFLTDRLWRCAVSR